MNTCETCKHWDAESYYQAHGVRKCNNVPMLWDAFEWAEQPNGDCIRVLSAEFADKKAFVQDGSDYRADLFTMKDFACNQWEESK